MAEGKRKNHLQDETSPYLLQHVYNPVDWYPWNAAAIAKARQENKPILLSIGYSACHWCHVMAHESFEDEATAQLMNQFFINIKLDREERPDLDKIYQLSHQMLNRRSGGWPLTVFLTPHDLTPFFAGTYFPLEPRYGLPSFKEILLSIARFYHEQPQAIQQQNQKLREILVHFAHSSNAVDTLDAQPLAEAITELLADYDHFNGGFGNAPKFPQPQYLNRLLRHAFYQQDQQLLELAYHTLIKMATGGLYDHIGGGFFRYSVDAHWHIPHFEKMLYDNAQLLTLYSDAWLAAQDPFLQQILLETGEWGLREMRAPEGGFYATLDADSEQQEGKFYCWELTEIEALLTDAEYQVIKTYFNLESPANFEQRWHFHIAHPLATVAEILQLPPVTTAALINQARHKLFLHREQRIRPGRDEKILTSWNGLMIQGMAAAGLRLAKQEFIVAAQQAVDFIRQHLWRNGRLLAAYTNGQARFMAYLDDYAFLLMGILQLLQAQWRTTDLLFAQELADALLQHYEDSQGGFFYTAHDHEQVLQRLKPYADEALPSGNGMAAIALGRLGYLLGNKRYIEAAEKTLKAAWDLIQQAPAEHHSLLVALEEHLIPPEIIIIRGNDPQLFVWQASCVQHYAPHRMVFAIPALEAHLPEPLAQKAATHDIIAYICAGTQCLAPITELNVLQANLTNKPQRLL